MKRKRIFLFLSIVLISSISATPYLRSMLAVFAYKEYNLSHSALRLQDVEFFIPGGEKTEEKDWFPIMSAFHDDMGFSEYTGKKLDLTVLYCYGDFGNIFGTSSFYDYRSPFYGAFYGGYAVSDLGNPDDAYGFDEKGNVVQDEVSRIPEYDMKFLVLPALGCPAGKAFFKTIEFRTTKNADYIGYRDWIRIDAVISTNGPAHLFKKWQIAYWQYGLPMKPEETDFKEEIFYGRIYARYFDEHDMSVFLYVMCRDKMLLEKCDREILSKSRIYCGKKMGKPCDK